MLLEKYLVFSLERKLEVVLFCQNKFRNTENNRKG